MAKKRLDLTAFARSMKRRYGGIGQEPINRQASEPVRFTGRGPDGQVQASNPAGVVHEGELVVSAPTVRNAGGPEALNAAIEQKSAESPSQIAPEPPRGQPPTLRTDLPRESRGLPQESDGGLPEFRGGGYVRRLPKFELGGMVPTRGIGDSDPLNLPTAGHTEPVTTSTFNPAPTDTEGINTPKTVTSFTSADGNTMPVANTSPTSPTNTTSPIVRSDNLITNPDLNVDTTRLDANKIGEVDQNNVSAGNVTADPITVKQNINPDGINLDQNVGAEDIIARDASVDTTNIAPDGTHVKALDGIRTADNQIEGGGDTTIKTRDINTATQEADQIAIDPNLKAREDANFGVVDFAPGSLEDRPNNEALNGFQGLLGDNVDALKAISEGRGQASELIRNIALSRLAGQQAAGNSRAEQIMAQEGVGPGARAAARARMRRDNAIASTGLQGQLAMDAVNRAEQATIQLVGIAERGKAFEEAKRQYGQNFDLTKANFGLETEKFNEFVNQFNDNYGLDIAKLDLNAQQANQQANLQADFKTSTDKLQADFKEADIHLQKRLAQMNDDLARAKADQDTVAVSRIQEEQNELQRRIQNNNDAFRRDSEELRANLQVSLANQSTGLESDKVNAANQLQADLANQQKDLDVEIANAGNQMTADLANQQKALDVKKTNAANDLTAALANQQTELASKTENARNDLTADLANQQMQIQKENMAFALTELQTNMTKWGSEFALQAFLGNADVAKTQADTLLLAGDTAGATALWKEKLGVDVDFSAIERKEDSKEFGDSIANLDADLKTIPEDFQLTRPDGIMTQEALDGPVGQDLMRAWNAMHRDDEVSADNFKSNDAFNTWAKNTFDTRQARESPYYNMVSNFTEGEMEGMIFGIESGEVDKDGNSIPLYNEENINDFQYAGQTGVEAAKTAMTNLWVSGGLTTDADGNIDINNDNPIWDIFNLGPKSESALQTKLETAGELPTGGNISSYPDIDPALGNKLTRLQPANIKPGSEEFPENGLTVNDFPVTMLRELKAEDPLAKELINGGYIDYASDRTKSELDGENIRGSEQIESWATELGMTTYESSKYSVDRFGDPMDISFVDPATGKRPEVMISGQIYQMVGWEKHDVDGGTRASLYAYATDADGRKTGEMIKIGQANPPS